MPMEKGEKPTHVVKGKIGADEICGKRGYPD